MLNEFKEFAVKGNVVDMGVGIVIGAAFTSIVTSFVEDIVNPLVGLFTGGVDFSNLFINLSGQDVASAIKAKEDGLAVITYGNFINAVIAFLIVAWVLFLIVKGVNHLKKQFEEEQAAAPEKAPEPSAEETLLAEIRDLLAKQSS
ncbi:MAG: large conductance mechanosensitive channel protein MscL [Pseudomonadota bacterium]